MARLIDTKGNVLTNNKNIINEVKIFYQTLYKKREVEDNEIVDLVTQIPCLSSDESDRLEGEITLEEATFTLRNMKNFKSPGTDGFSAEFFKMFWNKIGIFVVRALNAGFRQGKLSCPQREGIITCIPKGDKSREFIKNWRPITLLNVVYKIGSGSIANRIKTVLPMLINEDQTGFMANRYIGDNLRLIYDTIAYLEKYNLPGLLLNIDFEKAFDSLDWNFLFKVLKAFGFKKEICKWVHTFLEDIKSTVVVNGQISDWFNIERGCRQGDPISPYLFILCAEILAIMIREHKEIKGINISDKETKISQYADDTEFLLSGGKKSFENCINVLEIFGKSSGLFLNVEKTSAVWLGSKKNSPVQYMQHLKINWNPPRFKILGIWFTNNLKDCERINYEEKLAEIRKLFSIWLKRHITPLGRIAVLKSLILSKLIHLWILLPRPPDEYINQLQNLCFKFIWNGKQDRISRKTTVKNIEKGGLGIPDIKMFVSALKLTWIRKLHITEHKWKFIIKSECPDIDRLNIYGPEILNTQHNDFWDEVFKAYSLFYYKIKPNNLEELLAEPILYNNKIMVGNNILNYKHWVRKGVHCIAHFFDERGTLLSHTKFQEKYDIRINILTYNGYKLVIKKYCNKTGINVDHNKPLEISACMKTLYSVNKGSKLYYDILRKDNKKPNCCSKWEKKLNCTVLPDWDQCFEIIKNIKDISLKWLQIRIVHRILGTNVILKQMGITDDINCDFCKYHKDSIEHIFWKCPIVQAFWNELIHYITEKCYETNYDTTLNENIVLFGLDNNTKIDIFLNYILLFAKQYIYKSKMEKQQPTLVAFKKILLYRLKIEEYNIKLDDQNEDFYAKWYPYSLLLENDI